MYRWMSQLAKKAIVFATVFLVVCAFMSFNSEGEYVYSIISAIIIGGLFLLIFLLLFGQKIIIRDKKIIIQTGMIRRKRKLDDLTMITTLEYVHSKYSIDRRRLLFSFGDTNKSVELRLQLLNEVLLLDVLKEIESSCGEEIPIVYRGKWKTD